MLGKFAEVCCGRTPGAESWLEGACPQENVKEGCTVSKLGGECWHCAGSCNVSVWGAGEQGWEMAPASSIVPGEISKGFLLI